MTYPNCIGLYASYMGSGKTEVANILVQDYGYTPVKFAGPLKKMAESFLLSFGVDNNELNRYIEGDLKELELPGISGISPRRIMQTLGYEWGQEYLGPNIWCLIALKRVSMIIKAGGRAVIDDLRYPQEFQSLQELGACLVQVVRPGIETKTTVHRSEGLLNNHAFTQIINNDLDVSALKSSVHRMMDRFRSKIVMA